TDTYGPQPEPGLREAWKRKVGGETFILSVCRQSWEWKGNNIFLQAFARANNPDLRLVLMGWGPDMEKSQELVNTLGIQ
ncbi:hypothetical protein, partial [Vibrio cholerae]|uniref:hypothetical protein n=1 Tax=Vibrio cholerae TaxID=666 RepID=UPI001C40997F